MRTGEQSGEVLGPRRFLSSDKDRAIAHNNKERARAARAAWRAANPEKYKASVRKGSAKFRAKNKDDPSYKAKERARAKAYRAKNLDKVRAYDREREKRPDRRAWENRRYRENPEYRLTKRLRSALRDMCKGRQLRITRHDLGYDAKQLRAHLERGFLSGMNWANYGSIWHIEHIVAASDPIFDGPDGVKRAWALPNLRPWWAKENLAKSNRREFLI